MKTDVLAVHDAVTREIRMQVSRLLAHFREARATCLDLQHQLNIRKSPEEGAIAFAADITAALPTADLLLADSLRCRVQRYSKDWVAKELTRAQAEVARLRDVALQAEQEGRTRSSLLNDNVSRVESSGSGAPPVGSMFIAISKTDGFGCIPLLILMFIMALPLAIIYFPIYLILEIKHESTLRNLKQEAILEESESESSVRLAQTVSHAAETKYKLAETRVASLLG